MRIDLNADVGEGFADDPVLSWLVGGPGRKEWRIDEPPPGVWVPVPFRPATLDQTLSSKYTEGLQVGYRWYEANGVEPVFPFGYGLSYTTFELSDFAGGAQFPTDGEVELSAYDGVWLTGCGSRHALRPLHEPG